MEHNTIVVPFSQFICLKLTFNFKLCEQLFIFRITGADPEQFHQDLFPIMMTKMPAGTSAKNMVHDAQLISPGKFAQFDYGREGNLKFYNRTTPPEYDFTRITIPIRLYHGNNDIIANPLDTRLLYQKLPKPLGCVLIPYDKWNHVDFLWAKDVNQLLNDELLQFLRNATEDSAFIERSVATALEKRKNETVPVDVPFDEESFKNRKVSDTSGSSYIPDVLQQFIERNLWTI